MKLAAHDLSIAFGAVRAVDQVSVTVESGRRRAVIGPNGAGKTTLFNIISGAIRPDHGTVRCDDHDVTRWPEWRRARLGVGRTYQRSALLPELTVAENLALAVRRRRGTPWRFWPAREAEVAGEVTERLQSCGLDREANKEARTLSHGAQRFLEIEQVLALEPRALLLDEPMAGLTGGEREAVANRLSNLPANVSVLIVEHDLDVVFQVAQDITVLDHGRVVAEGSVDEVRQDPRVQEVYLNA